MGAQCREGSALLGRKPHFPSPRTQGNPQTCTPEAGSPDRVDLQGGGPGTPGGSRRPCVRGPGVQARGGQRAVAGAHRWSAQEGARLGLSGQLRTLEGRLAWGTRLGQHQSR